MSTNELIKKIELAKKHTYKEVQARIKEFEKVNKSNNNRWFHEICFCILTANTSAKMGIRIQKAISAKEFINLPENKLKEKLIQNSCRFFNRKHEYIINARQFAKIKDILKKFNNDFEKRDWIVENIKGIGMKEASHFLRNTGHFNVAILDKHVKNLLADHKIITKKLAEGNMNKTNYLEIESILETFAKKLNLSQGELDYYLWWNKTGEILK